MNDMMEALGYTNISNHDFVRKWNDSKRLPIKSAYMRSTFNAFGIEIYVTFYADLHAEFTWRPTHYRGNLDSAVNEWIAALDQQMKLRET